MYIHVHKFTNLYIHVYTFHEKYEHVCTMYMIGLYYSMVYTYHIHGSDMYIHVYAEVSGFKFQMVTSDSDSDHGVLISLAGHGPARD